MTHDHDGAPLEAMLRRTDMTRRAKGLLVEILTADRPDSLTAAGLWRSGLEGKHSIEATIRELERLGYLSRPGQRVDPATRRFVAGALEVHMPPLEVRA